MGDCSQELDEARWDYSEAVCAVVTPHHPMQIKDRHRDQIMPNGERYGADKRHGECDAKNDQDGLDRE